MKQHITQLALSILFSSAVASCGNNALNRDQVTTIPSGTATGMLFSGRYPIERIVTSCSGKCSAKYSGAIISVCDVGMRFTETITVEQTDGKVNVRSTSVPPLYTGGIYADGSFEIGGYATQYGGIITATARASGTIVNGRLSAAAQSRITGQHDGESVDCTGAIEIRSTGSKLSGSDDD